MRFGFVGLTLYRDGGSPVLHLGRLTASGVMGGDSVSSSGIGGIFDGRPLFSAVPGRPSFRPPGPPKLTLLLKELVSDWKRSPLGWCSVEEAMSDDAMESMCVTSVP